VIAADGQAVAVAAEGDHAQVRCGQLVPGNEIRLMARKPGCVIAAGATPIAMEDEIGREIYVRLR